MLKIEDCLYAGTCIVRMSGRVTLGEASEYFHKYLQQRIEEGQRFFILDCSEIMYVDSSGIAVIAMVPHRARMRGGRAIFVNPKNIRGVLQITKLESIIETAPDLASALRSILGEPVNVPSDLEFVDRYSVTMERKEGALKLVVDDRTTDPPKKVEYPVQEIPPPLQKPSSGQPLSLASIGGVALGALVIFALLTLGLVWVAKQISSVTLLVLIFCVALLFYLILIALVLLISGHLSEKIAEKLFVGVLGKIPGLGSLIPRVAARKGKNRV